MAHSITIAATNDALNQFAVQFAPDIKQVFRTGLEFETMLPMRSADHTYTAVNVEPASVMQPYQPQFTPNNTESFDAVSNVLRPIKIDLTYNEEQLQKFFSTWKNMWFEGGKDPRTWTYPKFLMEQVVAPKFREELNLLAWDGEYLAPTPGTAGASLESADGFRIQIENAITDSVLTPVASGAYTSSNIRSKVEDWFLAMPENVRSKGGTLLMSATHAREYYFDFRGDFATATWAGLQAAGGLQVDGFGVKIVGIEAMEGSDRWIFLPANQDNMIIGTRTGYPTYPQFIFDFDLYNLYVKAVFYRFFGFEHFGNLYVNDQA
jgi:hypothetical protein